MAVDDTKLKVRVSYRHCGVAEGSEIEEGRRSVRVCAWHQRNIRKECSSTFLLPSCWFLRFFPLSLALPVLHLFAEEWAEPGSSGNTGKVWLREAGVRKAPTLSQEKYRKYTTTEKYRCQESHHQLYAAVSLAPTPRMLFGPNLQVLCISLGLPASHFHLSVILLSLYLHNHIFLVYIIFLLDVYFFLTLQKEDHMRQR